MLVLMLVVCACCELCWCDVLVLFGVWCMFVILFCLVLCVLVCLFGVLYCIVVALVLFCVLCCVDAFVLGEA